MLRKFPTMRRASHRVPLLTGWWIEIQFFWHTRNKAPWVVALIFAAIVATFGGLTQLIGTNRAESRELTCLALNVYYEARGEPLAGMYAVAEVTMNRVASHRYPETVCGVVYEKRWDWLRKRNVGAPSSTPKPPATKAAIGRTIQNGRCTPAGNIIGNASARWGEPVSA